MIDPQAEARMIVERLECSRSACICHASARRGYGLTHASWRGDEDASLNVSVHNDYVLVCDHGRRDQEDTIAQLRALGLWHGPSGRPRVRVARMPKGAKDVADLLEQGRDAEYEQMIRLAEPAVLWMAKEASNPRSEHFGRLGEFLQQLDEVSLEAYIRHVAVQSETPVEVVRDEVTDYLSARRGIVASETKHDVFADLDV